MKKLYILILLVFISCLQKNKTSISSTENDIQLLAKEHEVPKFIVDSTKEENGLSFNKILKELRTKTVPLIAATNFDTFIEEIKIYNKEEVEALQLEILYPNYYKSGYNYRAMPNYKMDLSKYFNSIVVSVFKGDNEMESILINYDLKGKIIDSKVISYDEIAEGMSRIHSEINNNVITIMNEFYGDHKQIDTTKFHINKNGDINQIKTKFSSKLRPNKSIVLNKIYTDTIQFLNYNDDGDYPHIEARKGRRTIGLNYNLEWHDNEKYNFKYGDIVKVKWKMDSVFHAGDGETLDFSERVIDVVRVLSGNEPIKFLWRENKFDEELNQEMNSIIINESFCSSISNQEKAALGYISYDIGSECWWDKKRNKEGTNLKCKIVTALDLGYQCSDKQLIFLRKWFSKDIVALKKLESCRTMPYTATIQTTFDEIRISNDKKKQIITISYMVHGVNMRLSESWKWTKTDTFKYNSENLTLISSRKDDPAKEDEIKIINDTIK